MKISVNNNHANVELGASLIGYKIDTVELKHEDFVKLISMNEVDRYRYLVHIERKMRPVQPTLLDRIKALLGR
jgi:hypothetical protein